MRHLKKHRFIIIVILSVYLFSILAFFSAHYYRTVKFNSTKHTFSFPQTANGIKYTIAPRGGLSDSWLKRDVKDIAGTNELWGTVYEGIVSNEGYFLMKDWNVRINISEKCFLNKGWCGTIEIHQNTAESSKGNEKIQLLDLREMTQKDISLDYIVIDQEILLPLSKGDYIIYYPTPEFEEQIQSNSDCRTGLIFYSAEKEINFTEYEFNYHLHKSIYEGKEFDILIYAAAFWFLLFIAFLSYLFSDYKAQKKLRQKDEFIEEALNVCSKFIDAKDSYTNGHSSRVAEYAEKIAIELGFSKTEAKDIFQMALLHDCGKCYISDSVLKKAGKLTSEEYESIKKHTEYGAAILENLKSFPEICNGALYHHERFDGTGYPTGKTGEEIPLIGRIICVADSFDAMNSSRCYREPLPMKKIIEELQNGKGTQFDPKVVDSFLKILKRENNFMS